jgi:hypothetical protein
MTSIDAGRLCPLGLVMIKSLLPTDLGHNHQVLAYAYRLEGGRATIWVYDPNSPGADDVTLSFDLSDASNPIDVTHNVNSDGPVYAFFSTSYDASRPPGGLVSLRVFSAARRISFAAGVRVPMTTAGATSVRSWVASS